MIQICTSYHYHHHQVCVAGKGTKTTKDHPSPQITAGEQLESCQARSSRLFLGQPGQHFHVLLKSRLRDSLNVDLTTEEQTSWNVVGQSCAVAKTCCVLASDLLC